MDGFYFKVFPLFPVVDCQVSPWGPWSDCDAECGSGTMSRTRTIQVQPENGGRHCPSLQQRRGCQVSNCHHQDHAIKGNHKIVSFLSRNPNIIIIIIIHNHNNNQYLGSYEINFFS